MNARSILASLSLSLLLAECSLVNSPLSDVPISDPSLLQIIAVANRTIAVNGGESSTICVNLYDKHGYYVKVKDGSVTVNGQLMHDSYFGEYVWTDQPASPNFTYRFTVTMSDGSQHSCDVRTPADLRTFAVPPSYDRRTPLVLSWSAADGALPTTVLFEGDSASVSFSAAPGVSSMTLAPAALVGLHSGQTVRVTASIGRTGRVEAGFMSTSRCSATFSVSRNMRM